MKEILKLDHIQKYYGNGGNVTNGFRDFSFLIPLFPFEEI